MENRTMSAAHAAQMKIDLRLSDGDWQVVVERDGQQQRLAGVDELILYLQAIANAPPRRVRGLR